MQCDTDKEKKRQVKNLASDGGGGVGRMMKGKKGMKPESDILICCRQENGSVYGPPTKLDFEVQNILAQKIPA